MDSFSPRIAPSKKTLSPVTGLEGPSVKQSLGQIYSQMNSKEKTRAILQRDPEDRTAGELELLLPLLKEIQFFKEREMKQRDIIEICTHLRYQYFSQGQDVIVFGERGNKFYIMLEGEVGVLLPANSKVSQYLEEQGSIKARNEKDKSVPSTHRATTPNLRSIQLPIEVKSSRTQKTSGLQSRQSLSINQGFKASRMENDSQDDEEFQVEYNQVAVLSGGKSFGELALIKNKPRAATIRCLTNCHFAVVDRYDYKKVLGKIEQKRMNHMIDYLISLPYFKHWTRHAVAKLQYFFTKRELNRHQYLFAEGDPAELVYIIVKGQLEAFTSVLRTEKKQVDVEKLIEHSQQQKARHFKGNFQVTRGFHARIALQSTAVTKNFERIRVALMMDGNIVGDEDILRSLANNVETTRRYSVRCISQKAEILIIKKEEFIKRLRLSDETWDLILKSCRLKEDHFLLKLRSEAQTLVQKGIEQISQKEQKSQTPERRKSGVEHLNLRDAFINFNYPHSELKQIYEKRKKAPLRERLSSARRKPSKAKISQDFTKSPDIRHPRKLNVKNAEKLIKKEEELEKRQHQKKISTFSINSVQQKKEAMKRNYFNKKRASGDSQFILQVAHYCQKEPETARAFDSAMEAVPISMNKTASEFNKTPTKPPSPPPPERLLSKLSSIKRSKSTRAGRSDFFAFRQPKVFETELRPRQRSESPDEILNIKTLSDARGGSGRELSIMRKFLRNQEEVSEQNQTLMRKSTKGTNIFAKPTPPRLVPKFIQPALDVSFSHENIFKAPGSKRQVVKRLVQTPFRTPTHKNRIVLRRESSPQVYSALRVKGYMPQACTINGKSQLLVKSGSGAGTGSERSLVTRRFSSPKKL